MPPKKEGERPNGIPVTQQEARAHPPAAQPGRSPHEQAFWQNMLDRAGAPDELEDPNFYPVYLLARTEDFILNGRRGPNGLLRDEQSRAHIAPMHQTIHTIKTAYQMLAYPYCRAPSNRANIEADLARDRVLLERDSVELTGKEAMILGALARITDIPFNEGKHRYSHSEVLPAPHR